MKLNLRLLNSTFTFDVTGKISMSYTKDGDMEIVESIGAEEPVKELKPVPVVKPVKAEEPNKVTPCVPSKSDKCHDALEYIASIRDDEIVQKIRTYLGDRLSDKQFDDIIATMKLYTSKMLQGSKSNDGRNRIRELTYVAMFIMAGEKIISTRRWLYNHVFDITFTHKKVENIVYGVGSSCLIADKLWPQRPCRKKATTKPLCSKTDAIAVRHQKIIDIALKGYSVPMIAAYFGLSYQSIYNILNGKYKVKHRVNYHGEYPIQAVVPGGSFIPVTLCKCCKDIIPVKRLINAPNIEICVNCQNKKEEHK